MPNYSNRGIITNFPSIVQKKQLFGQESTLNALEWSRISSSPILLPGPAPSRPSFRPRRGPVCKYQEKGWLENIFRSNDVLLSWELAKGKYVNEAVIQHVGEDFYEAIKGVLPGLAIAFGTFIATTAIGAVIGAAVGALAGGVGAAPGAVAGAALGAKAGFWLLNLLGLGFLIKYVGERIDEVGDHLNQGIKIAWNSCGNQSSLHAAAKEMANAFGLLFSLLLQAVIAYIAKVGMTKAFQQLSKTRVGKIIEAFLQDKVAKYPGLKAIGNGPGDYHYNNDAKGRPLSAEGWLIRKKGGRIPGEQNKVTQGLKDYDGSHLIPDDFGGAGTVKNLVPMHKRHNRSYISAIEKQIGRYLAEFGDGNVYVKVTVRYSGDSKIPNAVTHKFFGRTEKGDIIDLGEVFTNLQDIPSQPMGKILMPDGTSLKPKDFQSPDPRKGVASGTPEQPN